MVVNYNTDRLIVLHFPRNGGGKFISLCLALDKNMLHQDRRAAVRKMNGKSTKQEAFEFSCSIINQDSDVHTLRFSSVSFALALSTGCRHGGFVYAIDFTLS